jgi:peptidoglycan-associated lipoprotein
MVAGKRILFTLTVLGAGLGLLAGCSSTKLDPEVPVETRAPASTSTAGTGAGTGGASGAAKPAGTGAASSGTAQSAVTPVDLTKTATVALGNLPRVVYFDFDSYVVKEEFRGTVESYAKVLAADRNKRLAIEGHTDERGGREYNLALGQKRAEAVAKSLALLGAKENQVDAVSFGKERPAVQGTDESAWAKNRRAELNSR